MVKFKNAIFSLLVALCILFICGCGGSHKDFVLYGRFQDNVTTDKFEVSCDWGAINPLLEEHKYEQYGLYSGAFFTFREFEEDINSIALFNYPPNDENTNNSSPGAVDVSYGAIISNSVESKNHEGERYFAEPMIQIHLYNPKAKGGESVPDYLPGYRAVYSLDGELALEEGKWFLDEDKDEFCRSYFEIMLKVIGKDK